MTTVTVVTVDRNKLVYMTLQHYVSAIGIIYDSVAMALEHLCACFTLSEGELTGLRISAMYSQWCNWTRFCILLVYYAWETWPPIWLPKVCAPTWICLMVGEKCHMVVWKLSLWVLIYNIKFTKYLVLLALFMQSLNIKLSH